MRIRYSSSIDDIAAFNVFHMKQSGQICKVRLLTLLFMPCMLLILSLPSILMGDWKFLWPLIIIWGLVSLFILKMTGHKRIKKQATKIYQKSRQTRFPGESELEISEDYIIERSEQSESKRKFLCIEKIGLAADYAFIYIGPVQAIIIPKLKVLEGDFDEFVAELTRKTMQRKEGDETKEKVEEDIQIITDPRQLHYEDRNFGNHSRLGIASFVIPLFVIFLDALAFIFSMVLGIVSGRGFSEESSFMIFALVVMVGAMADLIGLILGIAGACQKNRKKIFAVLGIIINSALLLALICLMIISNIS
jgi:hypothetical protein